MLLHFLIYILFYWLLGTNCATFYMDDGDQQSLPFSVGGQRMNHFRAQMLNLMGLKKPSGDIKVGDKFASRFMSMLYKEVSQSEGELRFNPNFRLFNAEESAHPLNFDYGRIEADSHASDTIISFVPKRITRASNASQLYELVFEFSAAEFQNLRLIGAELYLILEGGGGFGGGNGFPLKSSEILVKGAEEQDSCHSTQLLVLFRLVNSLVSMQNLGLSSNSYHINFDDFSSSGEYTFFSLNISRLLSFWPTFVHPTAERKVWIEFLSVDGGDANATAIDLPKMHCFGVGFFVEGEREIMKRVRRSFDTAFEVEEEWDEDEEDANGEENDDKSAAGDRARTGGVNETELKRVDAVMSATDGEGEEAAAQNVSDALSAGLMADEEEMSSTPPAPTLVTNTTGREADFGEANSNSNRSSSANSSLADGLSSKLKATKATESFMRAASPKFGVSGGFQSLKGSRRCRVRSLYVDFKDLGWDGWVIAPTGYQADYCDGDCSFPLDVSLNPTNHAIVQALVHLFDEKRALPAKCAPIAMRAQSLLFFNNQKNVVMRRYQNMRVKQCGCR